MTNEATPQRLRNFQVTGQYRQDIHADVEATDERAALVKASEMFEKWLEKVDDLEGITFGPDEASLDEGVLITEARTPTKEDPSCWTRQEEYLIYRDSEGKFFITGDGGKVL